MERTWNLTRGMLKLCWLTDFIDQLEKVSRMPFALAFLKVMYLCIGHCRGRCVGGRKSLRVAKVFVLINLEVAS